MLNLNYNINNALGEGNCRGLVKFNYSASLLVVGGGAGMPPLTASQARGGGGAGFLWTGSLNIIPNVTYSVFVAESSSIGGVGNQSKLVGFDDSDTNPFVVISEGGEIQTIDPVNSIYRGGAGGSGSLFNKGVTTNYAGYVGGNTMAAIRGGTLHFAAGGGAGVRGNGGDGDVYAAGGASGGIGGIGYDALDWGIVGGIGPTSIISVGGSGEAIGATVAPQTIRPAALGQGASYNASIGGKGVIVIKYAGTPKAVITNGTTSEAGGYTYHTFNPGTGSFYYQYPYPWTDVTPYTVEVCPDEHNEDVRPEIYWDYSYITNLNRFPAVSPFISSSYATMSINAVNTNCTNIVSTNNNVFTTNAQSTVVASLTGSNWPSTGSVTMSISVAGITYDPLATNQYYSASFSASSTVYNSNLSITGSIISSSFLASEFYRFYVESTLVHNYGVSIPTGGLIQWLDASDPLSYPGSGSVWYDLSPYGHNATASFGSTFPTWSNGIFNFNGTSDTVTSLFTSSLSAFSLVVWAKIASLTPPLSSSSGGALSLASASRVTGTEGISVKFDSLTFDENREDRWEIATENNNRDVTSSLQETNTNDYLMISMTNAGISGSQKLYRNQQLVGSGSKGSQYLPGTGSLMIVGNRYYPDENGQGYAPEGFFTGSIIGTLIYNRELSQSEIIDIFNAGI